MAKNYNVLCSLLGTLQSPTLLPDHRQVLSSRLVCQESPPISPLLYQPGSFPAGAVPHHPQLHQPPSSAVHQYSNIVQPKPVPEIWVQKSDFVTSASASGFEVASASVGYGVHPGMKTITVMPTQHHQVIQMPHSQPQVSSFAIPKVERVHSPAEIMEIQH